MSQHDTVPFGMQDIPKSDKPQKVQQVFTSVAQRYDVMNDLMSGFQHRLWRRYLINRMLPQPYDHLIDIAGGTADIALRFMKAGGGKATVCDLTAAMIDKGQERTTDAGYSDDEVDFCVAPAENLPFASAQFTMATIAFGLRNTTDPLLALKEAHRVLVAGGRFYCLEFSQPPSPLWRRAVFQYNRQVLPFMGRVIVRDAESYRYLAQSIARFYDAPTLSEMMREAGFKAVKHTLHHGGVVAVHSGVSSGAWSSVVERETNAHYS